MLFTYKFLSSQFTDKHILRDYDGDKKEYQLSRRKKSFDVIISDSGTYLDLWVISKTSSNASVNTVLSKLGIVVEKGVATSIPDGYTKCTLLDGEAVVHATYDKLFKIAEVLGIRRRVPKDTTENTSSSL